MAVVIHIDQDFKSLRTYFEKLFALRDDVENDESAFKPIAYDGDAKEYPGSQFYVSHLIKPDMALGVYSFFEFWIKRLAKLREDDQCLSLGYRDVKGKNDLDAYQKYLTRVAGLKLDEVQPSYLRLNELRRVRNKLIHKWPAYCGF